MAGEFSSPKLTFCDDYFLGVHSNPVLLQWHIKDLGHSAKSAGGRLYVNMHTSLNQPSRSGLTMLSRYSAGTYQDYELTRMSHCSVILALRVELVFTS